MTFNYGPNFKKDYSKLTEEQKEEHIDQMMQRFNYILYLKVGAANISQNKVSEEIQLNKHMQV